MSKHPMKSKRQWGRALLGFAATAAILGGIVILTRVYFLSQTPETSKMELPTDELPTNNPVSISGVTTSVSTDGVEVWGEKVTTTFGLPTNKPWVKINQSSAVSLGEIVKGEFTLDASLPANTAYVDIFPDYSLLYYTSSTTTEPASLWGRYQDDVSKLHTLQSGEEFQSVVFDPGSRYIYFSITTNNSSTKIQRLNARNKISNILEAEPSTVPIIKYVDNDQSSLFYSESNTEEKETCFELELINKEISTKKCSLIPQTADGVLYTATFTSDDQFTSSDVVKIKKSNARTGNIQLVLEGDPGEYYGNLSWRGNLLAYMVFTLQQVNEEIYELLPLRIDVFNLSTKQMQRYVHDFPEGFVDLEIDKDGYLLLIANHLSDGQQLWIETAALPEREVEEGGEVEEEDWQVIEVEGCDVGCEYGFM